MNKLYKIKVMLLMCLAIVLTSAFTIIVLPEGTYRIILNIVFGVVIGNISQYFLNKE